MVNYKTFLLTLLILIILGITASSKELIFQDESITTSSNIDENFYVNIENNWNDKVRLNISKQTGDNYNLKLRPGRHWVISGDEI